MPVSSAKHFNLFSFEFDDSALTDEETLLACMRMFMEMNFMERFYINKYVCERVNEINNAVRLLMTMSFLTCIRSFVDGYAALKRTTDQ